MGGASPPPTRVLGQWAGAWAEPEVEVPRTRGHRVGRIAPGLRRRSGSCCSAGLGARTPGRPSMAVEEEGLRVFQSVKIKIGELPGAGGGGGVFEGACGGRPKAPDPFPGGQGPDASWPCALPGCGPLPTPGRSPAAAPPHLPGGRGPRPPPHHREMPGRGSLPISRRCPAAALSPPPPRTGWAAPGRRLRGTQLPALPPRH